MPKNITEGHSYRYYPRGWVEIRGGRVAVFLSVYLATDKFVLEKIRDEFGLFPANGIAKVTFKPDGSVHYRCHLDDLLV